MKMTTASVALVVALLVFTFQVALSSTFPAFLWSPHLDGMENMVEYRVRSPKDLARDTMIKGGWLKYLCSAEEVDKPKKFAFLFIGKELQSMDISRPKTTVPALIDLLKDSITSSNFSLSFPYVSAEAEEGAIESSIISEFADTCQHSLKMSNIAFVGSCSMKGEHFDKLKDIDSVPGYLSSRIKMIPDGRTDLIVLCHGDSLPLRDSDQQSDGIILSQLLNSVAQLGAKYTVLYVSDPFRSFKQLSSRGLERFLAEGTMGNESSISTCDGVCQIKSSLLEGLLVGIVLLVILISGLCCMMGIDTPTRFETPQDT